VDSPARRAILEALRAVRVPDAPLPDYRAPVDSPAPPRSGADLDSPSPPRSGGEGGERGAIPAADLAERFAELLASVGGVCARVADPVALAAEVRALAERLGASRVVIEVPAAGAGSVRLAELRDPHELEGVDLAVLPGAFGVAENGAVWVEAGKLGHRGVFVVTQHLALVVPRAELVADMHAAYERLSFDGPGFGVFVSGPSKTADIEQALVIGAHGARSCTVFLVG
jgi:L-lactate dehydrogenase complex protein LldG